MKLPRYEYSTESEAELFKFTSEGIKGSIEKLVVYSQMFQQDVYNLAFGDYDKETNSIDDTVITNNNDSQKVLATVASTLYVFYRQASKCLGLCNRQQFCQDKTLQNGNYYKS